MLIAGANYVELDDLTERGESVDLGTWLTTIGPAATVVGLGFVLLAISSFQDR